MKQKYVIPTAVAAASAALMLFFWWCGGFNFDKRGVDTFMCAFSTSLSAFFGFMITLTVNDK